MKEDFLEKRLNERKEQQAYRELKLPDKAMSDFCSNDYLGIVTNGLLQTDTSVTLRSGSTGSRLLAGNYELIERVESQLAAFHEARAALVYNSGYDANTGLLGSMAGKGDTILYDFLSHASLRDGIRLSAAASFPFLHNDLNDLERRLQTSAGSPGEVFVVTESVFSMDGDMAPLILMAALCERFNVHLVVDEAHATGVTGQRGEGLVQSLSLEASCFARVHTFGKAVGCHGAVVLGSRLLRDFLINFSRPFIYTTALPESSLHCIESAYQLFPGMHKERAKLAQLIAVFGNAVLPYEKLSSETAIQGVIVPGNEAVKKLAFRLRENGLDVRPILYPTVPKGRERLRIVLHSFNTEAEMERLIEKITYF